MKARKPIETDVSEDELFEMSNLTPGETGLANRIWISVNVNQRHHLRHLKVEGPDKKLYPLSIDEPVEFLAGRPPGLSEAQFRDLQSFVALNREVVLAHCNDQISSKEAIERIQPI